MKGNNPTVNQHKSSIAAYTLAIWLHSTELSVRILMAMCGARDADLQQWIPNWFCPLEIGMPQNAVFSNCHLKRMLCHDLLWDEIKQVF